MSDGYRSPGDDPRELRSRAANRTAGQTLIVSILLVIIILAIVT